MNFARKQLEKYGWTDGKGLGKNEDGISQALKPKLKRSVAGIGHDAAADFTEHWWTQLYDKAASNVEVEYENGKTKKIKTIDRDEFEITNSTWRLRRKKKKGTEGKEQYEDFFVKKAVLTKGGAKIETAGETDSEDDEEGKKNVLRMTDEELFAACGGRTAHKGARHGLKATGKLARIAQQEQQLLIQPQYDGYSHAEKLKNKKKTACDLQIVEDMSLNSDGDASATKKKKKKRKRCTSLNNAKAETVELEDPLPENNKSKNNDNVASDNEAVDSISKTKKSKKENDLNCDSGNAKKSKKKKNYAVPEAIHEESINKNCKENHVNIKKNKKKKLNNNEEKPEG